MAKHAKRASAPHRAAKSGAKRGRGQYEIVGVTSDGVSILRGAVKPKHFTSKQIREAILAVVGDRKS